MFIGALKNEEPEQLMEKTLMILILFSKYFTMDIHHLAILSLVLFVAESSLAQEDLTTSKCRFLHFFCQKIFFVRIRKNIDKILIIRRKMSNFIFIVSEPLN